MKLVRESINEKFTENSDPISDMDIGVDIIRTFESQTELTKWVYKHLAHILETDKIPEDVLMGKTYYLKPEYIQEIMNYCKKYFRLKNESHYTQRNPMWNYLHEILKQKGFPTNIDESFLFEEIDAKEAYTDKDALQTVIDGKRNIALIQIPNYVDSFSKESIENEGLQVLMINDPNGRFPQLAIVYNEDTKDNAILLRQYIIDHDGYISDYTPEEAQYVGNLLEYTQKSIDEYIFKRYYNKK
jgi:hypothetical protein